MTNTRRATLKKAVSGIVLTAIAGFAFLALRRYGMWAVHAHPHWSAFGVVLASLALIALIAAVLYAVMDTAIQGYLDVNRSVESRESYGEWIGRLMALALTTIGCFTVTIAGLREAFKIYHFTGIQIVMLVIVAVLANLGTGVIGMGLFRGSKFWGGKVKPTTPDLSLLSAVDLRLIGTSHDTGLWAIVQDLTGKVSAHYVDHQVAVNPLPFEASIGRGEHPDHRYWLSADGRLTEIGYTHKSVTHIEFALENADYYGGDSHRVVMVQSMVHATKAHRIWVKEGWVPRVRTTATESAQSQRDAS